MSALNDRVIVVTGATGNLGGAVTLACASAGAHVVPVDRGEGRLAKAYPALAGSPEHLLAESVDVSDAEAVHRMFQAVTGRFGHVDGLVNTVGGFRPGAALQDTPIETWQALMDLNSKTVFVTCRAVIPLMLERGAGRIVSVAARAGLAGSARLSAYTASKAAVIRITESLSAEVKARGVNVNCVLPGTIDTPENRASMLEADASRWVAPEAIADVIVFLLSDAARAIHGASIPVYGLS